jgi:hypothetical protein
MPAELANAAAAMGLPVSSSRYAPETTDSRNKRAVAYAEDVAMEAKLRPVGVPKHLHARPPKRTQEALISRTVSTVPPDD